MRYLVFIFFLLFNLNANELYENGQSLYKEKGCASCHGNKLEGMHRYPYLANRSRGFLTYKLKRFRSQISDNQQQEMMIPFAMSLSDAEIDSLTLYINEYVEDKNEKSYDDSFESYGDGGS